VHPYFFIQVKLNGLSGLVSFDNQTRSRMVDRLDIVNVQVQVDENENAVSVLENVSCTDVMKIHSLHNHPSGARW